MPQQVNVYKKLRFGREDQKAVSSTPDYKFVEFRVGSSATSGDNRAIYNRFYMTGAGGGGESLRSYTDVVGVVLGTAHGAHISLGFGESTTKGSVTGLGVAVRATLGFPDAAMASGGTYAALMPEIYCFGTSSTTVTAVTELSLIRCVLGGHSTGIGLVDHKAYFLVIAGNSVDTNHICEAATDETEYAYNLRCSIGGTDMYIMCASARA